MTLFRSSASHSVFFKQKHVRTGNDVSVFFQTHRPFPLVLGNHGDQETTQKQKQGVCVCVCLHMIKETNTYEFHVYSPVKSSALDQVCTYEITELVKEPMVMSQT